MAFFKRYCYFLSTNIYNHLRINIYICVIIDLIFFDRYFHETWTQLEMCGAEIDENFYAQSIIIDAVHQSSFVR